MGQREILCVGTRAWSLGKEFKVWGGGEKEEERFEHHCEIREGQLANIQNKGCM